jgi:hypothetical protein
LSFNRIGVKPAKKLPIPGASASPRRFRAAKVLFQQYIGRQGVKHYTIFENAPSGRSL